MLNTQPIEAVDKNGDGLLLDVVKIWYTIQGEGMYAGRPAVFIRLAGCNLQCPLCDTDYTTNRKPHRIGSILDKVERVAASKVRPLVVISGGEPLRQPIHLLVDLLTKYGYMVQIETNGTIMRTEIKACNPFLLNITVSPKTPKIHPEIPNYANCWKYVLSANAVSKKDGLPLGVLDNIGAQVARPPLDVPPHHIFLQPCMDPRADVTADNIKATVKSCQEYGYRLSLQTHKIIGME